MCIRDRPFEERDEIKGFADAAGVYSISLVAPTSHERIKMIASEAKGFLYCVSSTGVTGVRDRFSTDFQEFFDAIERYTAAPAAVGFGIASPEQAKVMKQYCEGVIVGSAIVERVAEHGVEAAAPVEEFVASLRKALDE